MNEKWMKVRSAARRGLSGLLSLVMAASLVQPGMVRAAQYVCGQEEHAHGAACYETVVEQNTVRQLTCERQRLEYHGHDAETCYAREEGQEPVLICTIPQMQEHIHDDSCYSDVVEETETKNLICTLGEHTHTGDCEAQKEPAGPDAAVYAAHEEALKALEDQVRYFLNLSPDAEGYDNLDSQIAQAFEEAVEECEYNS